MSFVRAYSKHEASYIFRLKNLDLVQVAKSFGLLRLPKMPELKDAKIDDWQNAEVEVSFLSSFLRDFLMTSAVGFLRVR